jgi:PadR family transcriptional regulator PadR
LVDAEWQDSPQGPKRKYYTLTDRGLGRLEAMRADWRRFAADVDGLLRSSEQGEEGET